MVLDTSALVAILLREPGWEDLAAKLEAAEEVIVGAPTLLECALVLSARLGQDARPLLWSILRRIQAEIVPFNEEHLDAAISAFLRFGRGRHAAELNFGDCMSYALCTVSGLPLLFSGDDFARTDLRRT